MFLVVFLNIIIHGCFIGSRVVMALFALELGANAFEIGFMVALYSLPPLGLGIVAGLVTDRYGVRPPMVFGAALSGIGLMLPYVRPQLGTLYASAAVIGTAFVFYNVAVQNLAGAFGPREERAQNFSTLSLGYSVSSFAGPMVAGYAIDLLSYRAAYLCFSVSTLVPFLVVLFDRQLRRVALPRAAPGSRNFLELLRLPELRKVLITGAMVSTGWDLYMFYLPLYGHAIGMHATLIGIVLGVFAAATFIVRFALPRFTRRYGGGRVLSVAMYCGAATFVLFPFIKEVWLLATLSFAIGLALGCGQPLTLLLCYNRSPAGRTGEVTGIRLSLNHATHSTVPIVAGGLGAAFGTAPVFFMIAAVLVLSGYLSSTVKRVSAGAPPV